MLFFAQAILADTVYQRGGVPPIHGRISIDDAGVNVITELGAKHHVPWDRVKDVDSEKPEQTLKSK